MREIVLDEPASEASALLAIDNRAVLAAHGWKRGFWTCSDEDSVDKGLGALGRGKDGWEMVRPRRVRPEPALRTEDAEAMARFGGWVYVIGSHFGSKAGPLESRRHFVARFREDQLEGRVDEADLEVEIARGRFRLHRLINDALRESGLRLIEPGEAERRCLRDTLKRGRKKGKTWADRLHKDDWPLDVEGAAFRKSGALLLGLRYPVTRDGHPILVEIDGVERMFRRRYQKAEASPSVRQLWVLGSVGSAREPRGVRGLEEQGPAFLAVTGSLDSTPEESLILEDHPEGERAESCLHRFRLPDLPRWRSVDADRVDDLAAESKAEGIAADGRGGLWYVLDDERIRLRRA